MASAAQKLESDEGRPKRSARLEAIASGVTGAIVEYVAAKSIHAVAELSTRAAILWALPFAAAAAAAVFLVLIRRWKKQPSAAVDTPIKLSYAQSGIDDVVKSARMRHPEFVLGINRGGAIVGGIIAKQLQKPIYLLSVESSKNGAPVVTEQWKTPVALEKAVVLLVDDACRTGTHMKAAINFLKTKYPNADICSAVLLHLDVFAPNELTFRPDIVGTTTKHSIQRLPWDLD